ncbi:MAG: acyl carrier protein [Dokdonella sp.]
MSNDPSTIRAAVRAYILENLMFSSNAADLPDDASLLDRGIIDSTGVLELVMFIEERFHIKVKDSDMLPQNFDTVDHLTRFVGSLASAA